MGHKVPTVKGHVVPTHTESTCCRNNSVSKFSSYKSEIKSTSAPVSREKKNTSVWDP